MRLSRIWALGLLVLCCANSASHAADLAGRELLYPGEAFAKLDTFEGLNLQDADKLYGKRDYTGAYAAYKAFSFEFAQSPALPYVLLRMGRCLHQLGKRYAAIKAYQDVVDYFPDDVRYAAGALYYIGECHGQNGDEAKQIAVWARMVKDDDYVAQPNSGTALTYLGKAMEQLGKFEEAVEYHKRTAVTFLKSNDRAAADARSAVLHHYVTRNPNHEKLKAFYVEAGGFDGRGYKTENPEEDTRYWITVLDRVLRMGGEAAQREKAARYWNGKMGDRFADHDGLRKQWIDLQMIYEKERTKWAERMEQQFAQKATDLNRVLQWCDYYNVDRKLQSAFYARHAKSVTSGLAFKEQMALMDRLRRLRMDEEAQAAMRAVRTGGLRDEELRDYAGFVAYYAPEEDVLRLFARMKDKLYATKCRFDYYHARHHRNRPFQEKALAEIPALKKSPKYAAGMDWAAADLLRSLGRYEEAIKAYRAANQQPGSTWGVTDCLVALKQYGQAIDTVQGLESVPATAPAAALKVADIYRVAGDKGKEVQQLRSVLRRFPKSGESSTAHQRLESYGVALIGGENEAEE